MNQIQTLADKKKNLVLIVDDNRDAADTLAMMLRYKGFVTITCYNGLDGVAAADAQQPMAIVLDIGMPDITGYEACRRIRQEPWGKLPTIIALTGYGSEDDRQKSKEAGFDAHLLKPVEINELLSLLTIITS